MGALSNSFSPNSFLRSDLHAYPDFSPITFSTPPLSTPQQAQRLKSFHRFKFVSHLGFVFVLGLWVWICDFGGC